ncbi:MAG: arsenate reductase ArsC [Gemmatimonadota bacterium]
MNETSGRPLRVLFLCTHNSARSQIAEALLSARRNTGLLAASAGTESAERVHPRAVEELARRGIDWSGARPKSVEDVADETWDIVITVCDRARERCPAFRGHPVTAHWRIADPTQVEGDEHERQHAFSEAALMLGRRIDLLLALPFRSLERMALEYRMGQIGTETNDNTSATGGRV